MQRIGRRHWMGSAASQLSSLLHRTSSHLELQEGAKSPMEKSLFILVGAEIRPDWRAKCCNFFRLLGKQSMDSYQTKWVCDPFLSSSLSYFFFKDTKTEKPNPLNNSYFDLQKTTNISSEQGKHVFSCIWVQEHWVFPLRSFKVHQTEGWSNRLSRQKECSLSSWFYSIIFPPLNTHTLII